MCFVCESDKIMIRVRRSEWGVTVSECDDCKLLVAVFFQGAVNGWEKGGL